MQWAYSSVGKDNRERVDVALDYCNWQAELVERLLAQPKVLELGVAAP